jgi:hypothetical protein
MSKKIEKGLTTFSDHLEEQYGKRGTAVREQYEQEFEAFRHDVLCKN